MERPPYKGSSHKLVLAFDIGTTYSGISYSILEPGQVPEIKAVTRFPANELISGASKIPAVIYYDQEGNVRALGAEATREGILEEAEDRDWTKVEWFKLHLRSKVDSEEDLTQHIPPLPPGKTIVDIFADFLRYLFQCSRDYIQDTHSNGRDLWISVKNRIAFVLSHPSGWGGVEQYRMRQAAVLAELVPDNEAGHSRVVFVTEGEASLHYALQNSVLSTSVKKNNGVMIVDAGGGTIDISSYSETEDGTYEEIAVPQSLSFGSVLVNFLAMSFLEELLKGSRYIDVLDDIIQCFDRTTKLRFRSREEYQYIKFGSSKDNEPRFNIRSGRLKLEGDDVALFFEPSIQAIVSSVSNQARNSHKKISHVTLVGGFASNDWVFQRVARFLTEHDLTVVRPENHVKAVSDGAISFYVDHFVRSRVSKFAYGSFRAVKFDPTDPEHQECRIKDLYTSNSGELMVKDTFGIILPKNTQVSEGKEFRTSLYRETSDEKTLASMVSIIWCYKGTNAKPKWKNIDADNYVMLCKIITDLSHLPLTSIKNAAGKEFFRVVFDIVLLFGLTELKAQIAWKENGVEKRGPARIVYDPVVITQDSENMDRPELILDGRDPSPDSSLPQSPKIITPSSPLSPDSRWKKGVSQLEEISLPKVFGWRDRQQKDTHNSMQFPQAFSSRKNERASEPVGISPLEKMGWKRTNTGSKTIKGEVGNGSMRLSRQ